MACVLEEILRAAILHETISAVGADLPRLRQRRFCLVLRVCSYFRIYSGFFALRFMTSTSFQGFWVNSI